MITPYLCAFLFAGIGALVAALGLTLIGRAFRMSGTFSANLLFVAGVVFGFLGSVVAVGMMFSILVGGGCQ